MARGQLNFDQIYKLQYLEELEREVVRLRLHRDELLHREQERQRAEYLRREAYWRNPVQNPHVVADGHWDHMYTVTGRMTGKNRLLEELRRGGEYAAEYRDPYMEYRDLWYEQDAAFQPLAKVQDSPTPANHKALELFRSRLNEWQRQTFEEHGCIDVRGGHSGSWWRIDTTGSTSKNVLNMATMVRYCFHLRDYGVPRFDHFTAQAVLIGLDDTKISQYPAQTEETITYRRKIDSLYPVKESA